MDKNPEREVIKMEELTNEEIKIAKFQESLSDIMELYGVTCAELGRRIGVSRAQVSNLRSGFSKMNKTMYIAILVALTHRENYIEGFYNDVTKRKIKKLQEKLERLET